LVTTDGSRLRSLRPDDEAPHRVFAQPRHHRHGRYQVLMRSLWPGAQLRLWRGGHLLLPGHPQPPRSSGEELLLCVTNRERTFASIFTFRSGTSRSRTAGRSSASLLAISSGDRDGVNNLRTVVIVLTALR